MLIKLTKLKESDNPRYPGNIPEGFIIEGSAEKFPEVGESFELDWWHTSTVQEILSPNTFRTHNSIYKWEVIMSYTFKHTKTYQHENTN